MAYWLNYGLLLSTGVIKSIQLSIIEASQCEVIW
jgi:hypothetical protein